jgi:hypothetical protein
MSSNAENRQKPLIACLGWGSLVWKPDDLSTKGEWHPDGPLLPLEFARQSTRGTSAGALTLVVVPGYSPPVRSLWTLLSSETPEDARETLRKRERVPERDREKSIALWRESDSHEPLVQELGAWARDHSLSAVVWTALPPRFNEATGRIPTVDEAVSYLRGLTGDRRQNAETYVRMAPRQIDTPYRQRFVAELGWTATGGV